MKEHFKKVLESKIFDGLLGIVVFLLIALSFDYASDEKISVGSFVLDLMFSLGLGIVIIIRPTHKKLNKEVIKKRNEQVELIGKVLIGILLFITLLVLMYLKS